MLRTSQQFLFLEIGGLGIVPQPGPPDGKLKPGCPMRPFFGVEPVLVNEKVLHGYLNSISLNYNYCLLIARWFLRLL